jgi:hypothetical protein
MDLFVYLLLSAITAGAGACLGSYLREKGKNAATKEDLDRLTRIAEEIKADLSGELWLRQTRWDLRRDLYVRLLEGLSDVRSAVRRLTTSVELSAQAKESGDSARTAHYAGEIQKRLEEYVEASHQVRRAHSVAEMFLSRAATEVLDKLEADRTALSPEGLTGVQYRDSIMGLIDAASKVLTEAARRDLLGLQKLGGSDGSTR